METSLSYLAWTAITIGTLHTLAGPDHYLPFVAMARTRSWSMVKTINIVALCGLGHVFSSVVIGFIGIGAGIAISGIVKVESSRGDVAAWLLLIFGIGYMIWGLYRLRRSHTHDHDHMKSDKKQMTFWILFAIFIFGPCEPLIPILMYPAAAHNYAAVALISILFAAATIITMVTIVVLMTRGISLIRFNILEKYQHVIAGATIAVCGIAIMAGL